MVLVKKILISDYATIRKTGLMWTKKCSAADLGRCVSWNSKDRYVANLRTGGYSDWRTPTINELQTIYDERYLTNKHTKGILGVLFC
ncbi:DUF1566 domain-containing protein [candidate division CSSED10-310 bacterium]|uniref:DUF1566 domain-containing protein n=1 Tax=candidate division CSSED10-310 bacterium TaxID=2855610 RepID=A0ABV6YXF3_UNCC1